MANAPTFVIVPEELDGTDMEPCTTDILIELFDFGEYTEAQLDALLADVKVGETFIVPCELYDTDFSWNITLRRVN